MCVCGVNSDTTKYAFQLYTQLGWPSIVTLHNGGRMKSLAQLRRQRARTQRPDRRQNFQGAAKNLAMVDPSIYKRTTTASTNKKLL